MNHSHGLNVTRGYVKIDYTPAWELNAKVIDFIFFSDEKSKQGKARDFEAPADKLFRISKKMMIYGRAYFKGKVVGELTDIGFSNVDEVISALVKQLPKDIPIGCTVQFRLTNCDSQKEAVYERSKGKGFKSLFKKMLPITDSCQTIKVKSNLCLLYTSPSPRD